MKDNKKDLSLYIHIPFCKSKCFYCDFNSFACRDNFVPAYFNALKKEIGLYSEKLIDYKIETVFVGGGTPSVVDEQNIYEVFSLLNEKLNIVASAEVSIETNPGTLSLSKLKAYKKMGANRLSIGLQAWQDSLLKRLGRIHTAKEFEDNFKLARQVGFDNINVDLIFGIPGQSFEDWFETLKSVTVLEPEHISCYSLKIEEGTIFGNQLDNGQLVPLDESIDREMYNFCKDYLASKGYKHYEISNFSKPGYECRHNLVYWDVKEYIGIGAGAHSYFENTRFNNVYDIESYIDNLEGAIIPSENLEVIDNKGSMSEFMILGLRLINGVHMDDFKRRFNEEIYNVYGNEIDKLVNRGFIGIKDGYIRLSSIGLDFANQVFMEFI